MSQSPDVVLIASTAHTGYPKTDQNCFEWMLVLSQNFSLICEGMCVGYDSE